MKRIASCLLALALLVTLTACSGKSDNLSDGTDTSGTVSDTVKDTEKDTETAPAETTGESNTTGAETGTEQPTSDSKATAPAKDTTSATNPPATNPPSTNPPATNPPTTNPPATNPPTPPSTVKTCNHSNTEVRNKKDATTSSEGYTGDTYCKDCGKLISSGSSIPKIKQTVSVSHDYYDIEMEIFRLINEERAKNGVAQLVWDEELYAGTKIRAQEVATNYSHTRPNGEKYYTALSGMYSYVGENFLRAVINCVSTDPAGMMMEAWINSDGHHRNMLDSGYGHAAIAIIKYNDEYIAVNIFTN